VTDTPVAAPSPASRSVVAQTKDSVAEVRHDAASVQETATELSAMVIAYAKQETIDPIKHLGRYVLFGVVGAVLFTVGATFLAVALLRALQTELSPHLRGDWSWVPYFGGVAVMAVGTTIAITRISKTFKTTPRGKDVRP
jgi:hypothetical protein